MAHLEDVPCASCVKVDGGSQGLIELDRRRRVEDNGDIMDEHVHVSLAYA